jgi:hypothetical protein
MLKWIILNNSQQKISINEGAKQFNILAQTILRNKIFEDKFLHELLLFVFH